MKISQSTRLRAAEAAEHYEKTKNLSETARELGIHRSTMDRWKKAGLLDVTDKPSFPVIGLDDLVDKALRVIDSALDGDGIKPNQIRAAIEVVKSSNALKAQAKVAEQQESLAEMIARESPSD